MKGFLEQQKITQLVKKFPALTQYKVHHRIQESLALYPAQNQFISVHISTPYFLGSLRFISASSSQPH
jgi:hypothetical protein